MNTWIFICFVHGILAIHEDAFLKTPQLLQKYGYPCEAHEVVTEDGYILTQFRIPFGKYNQNRSQKKVPILLHHGLLETSAHWVLKPPESLSYQLANEDYDVWLMNTRGNEHSFKHTILNQFDKEFWNYSLHEVGIYDLAATIDYVLKLTNHQQLFHIGHSQGTASLYALLSEKPDYNKKIITHISYAPVAYLNHATSPLLTTLASIERNFQGLSKVRTLIGDFNIAPSWDVLRLATSLGCDKRAPTQIFCLQFLDNFVGKSPLQLNTTLVPVLFGHLFVGSSLKQLLHFVQLNLSGFFRQFDYGYNMNIQKYGNPFPPKYKFQNMLVPIYIFYGANDALVDPIDAVKTANSLPNLQQSINMGEWGHEDFYIGNDVATQLFPQTLAILRNYVINNKII